MSKYIIDTGDYLFTTDGVLVVGFDCDNKPATFYNSLDNLEELNSDYINEHFSDLQDTAYQKGFEDGKAVQEKGCDGCEHECENKMTQTCILCCNAYKNRWIAKSDKIEVGDVVERYLNDKLDSTGIYLGEDGDYWNCLFWTGAVFGTFAYPKNQFKKTGRHFDIASILEDMRND